MVPKQIECLKSLIVPSTGTNENSPIILKSSSHCKTLRYSYVVHLTFHSGHGRTLLSKGETPFYWKA